MAKTNIYLDNCAYNRPFDDTDQCVKHDHFDYTEWQRDLWKDKTIEEIHQAAAAFYIGRLDKQAAAPRLSRAGTSASVNSQDAESYGQFINQTPLPVSFHHKYTPFAAFLIYDIFYDNFISPVL